MNVKSLKRAVRALIETCQDQLALSAAAVMRHQRAIVIPGLSNVGKSMVTAWLLSKGYRYLTDRLVFFPDTSSKIDSYPCPMVIGESEAGHLLTLMGIEKKTVHRERNKILIPESKLPIVPADLPLKAMLFLYPQYSPGSEITLLPLSAGQATAELMANTLNARLLPKHGITQAALLSRKIPACKVVFGHVGQFESVLENFIKLAVDSGFSYDHLRKLTKAMGGSASSGKRPSKENQPISTTQTFPIPAPTVKKGNHKLTIGMATYDDFDGVYFSVQAIRMYHPEVTDETEILVIDNHPDGAAAKPLKNLEQITGYRYIPFHRFNSTAVRDVIFREANADLVLCMDSHVLIQPGALAKLLLYYDKHPKTKDLLHGPMLSENHNSVLTHFKPTWGGGMYGKWGSDKRGDDPDNEPFEIQMQGLGLFSCRKAAWPGLNPRFLGFGGEEGYIHEKVRQRGGKALCLPFLRWLHRFARPTGVQYPLNWKDRIRNYYIGFTELGLDTDPVDSHFIEHLGRESFAAIKTEIVAELDNPFTYFDAIYLVSIDPQAEIDSFVEKYLRAAGIIHRIRRISATEFSEYDEIDWIRLHHKVVEEANLFDLENVLVIHADVTKDALSKMADNMTMINKNEWAVFYPGLGQPLTSNAIELEPFAQDPIPSSIIAYHRVAFNTLLGRLPER